MNPRSLVLASALVTIPGASVAQSSVMTELESGTTALLQAVSVVDASVLWVSGHEGAVLRSIDGGASWTQRPVQTLDSLQFRDVHAFDAQRAVILSAGPGDQSRIYRTTDGGETWTLSWTNEEPEGFYDCLDFWDDDRGIVYGDAVQGELRILLTEDGGGSWERIPADRLPPAVAGEGGFAASGTCVEAAHGGMAWIGTGAGERPRLLHTADYGETWGAIDLPLVAGDAAGAFTVAFNGARYGVVLGGDLSDPDGFSDNVAITADGGATWTLATRTPMPGAVYGAALGIVDGGALLLAAGPSGLAGTRDLTGPWRLLDPGSFWAVASLGSGAWAVGPEGRILKIEW